jgi:hypothetical protein
MRIGPRRPNLKGRIAARTSWKASAVGLGLLVLVILRACG